jgi:hypothetical protein
VSYPETLNGMSYVEILRDAMRQKYAMIERNSADEKWAEWHLHPETSIFIEQEAVRTRTNAWPAAIDPAILGSGLYGYPVRTDPSVPVGVIKLVCETDIEASVRHITDKGGHVTIYQPDPLIFPVMPPAPAPTVKALLKHWLSKARRR